MIQYKSNSRQLSLPVFDGQEGESGFHAYIKVPYPFSFRNGFSLLLILLVPCSGRMQSCSKNDEICPDKDVRILSSDWPGLIITSSDWTGLDSPRIEWTFVKVASYYSQVLASEVRRKCWPGVVTLSSWHTYSTKGESLHSSVMLSGYWRVFVKASLRFETRIRKQFARFRWRLTSWAIEFSGAKGD